MHTFFVVHLKQVLTVGFLLGALSLIIKILDEKLPQRHKESFGVWVQDSAPKLRSATITSLFAWFRKHRLLIMSIYVAVIFICEMVIAPGHFGSLSELPAAAFYGFVGGGYILSSRTLRQAIYKSVYFSCSTLLLPVYTYYLVFRDAFVRGNTYDKVAIDLELLIAAVRHLSLQTLGYAVLFFIAPIFLILLLRPPLIIIGKVLLWLSTYPKGAWAGLAFALTIIFGALRLFL